MNTEIFHRQIDNAYLRGWLPLDRCKLLEADDPIEVASAPKCIRRSRGGYQHALQ